MDKIDLRYQRGKIYTIRRYDDDTAIYVGSTIQPLSARMARHRSNKKCSLYQYVNGNWDNWYIELYEEYPCNNKQILEKREGEITRLIGNINKCIAGRTRQEHYNENKEKIKKKQKQYQESNKEQISKQRKEHYEDNKEILKKQVRDYYEANKEEILKKQKEKEICGHCGSEITKKYLKTHQKSKKCLEKQI